MIHQVKIKLLNVHKDERGDFREILRFTDGFLDRIEQISSGRTVPGIIKAFHWHKNQDDVFYVIKGDIQLVLYDAREDSPTNGQTQEILLGKSYEPKIVLIPRGVYHGYQVIGNKDAEVLYIMNQTYNPEDEHRVDHNDPSIGFDWNKISEKNEP